jgi:hypothetical protein
LIITTFGAVSLSRSLKPRPTSTGMPMTSKKFGDTTRRLMLLSRSRTSGAYARPCTKMPVLLTLPERSAGADKATPRPEVVPSRSSISR